MLAIADRRTEGDARQFVAPDESSGRSPSRDEIVQALAGTQGSRWLRFTIPIRTTGPRRLPGDHQMSKLDMLTPDNSAIALIDYQPAMFQGVQSHDRLVTVNNVQILAKAAKLFKIPTVLTTVARDSFSGPFMPEVTSLFPEHDVIDRTAMNSWLDANFRKAVAATGRKKFVLAGLWTEACVIFPTLDMLREGYEIYIAADACGDLSLEAHNRAMERAIQAGAVPITSSQYAYELQQDWARSETYEGMMDIQRAHSPYGIQIRFSKWALGEHASEGGTKAA
jgi:nicotinamidase-related amidase